MVFGERGRGREGVWREGRWGEREKEGRDRGWGWYLHIDIGQ